MTPTDQSEPPPSKGKRPAVGGGATYRHPAVHGQEPTYHDGVHDHALEDELHNPEVAHEHTDVNVRAITTSAIILVVVTIVSHLIVVFLFNQLEDDAAATQPQVSPVARPATEMPPTTTGSAIFNKAATGMSGPQLLTNEPMALHEQRAQEARKLQGYGWVNEGAGIAHMPIEDAKKLILERGLPVRADSTVAPTLGTHLPAAGEASGGRVITVPLPEPSAGAVPVQPGKGH